jgi:hypothetical protein
MLLRRLFAALTLASLLLVLAACGGSTPSTSNGEDAPAVNAEAGATPLYPDAKPLEGGSPMAMVVDNMKQQLKQQQQDADVTVDAYTLPVGSSFDKVKQFYDDALKAGEWTIAPGMDQAAAAMQGGGTAAWIKGDNQVLTIVVMPDPMQGGGNFLLVAQANKK